MRSRSIVTRMQPENHRQPPPANPQPQSAPFRVGSGGSPMPKRYHAMFDGAMTHAPYEPAPSHDPPAPEQPSRPPLRRQRDDRVLGGVCSGVAQNLGVDPVLVRVVVVVLALFGGGGVLVYLAAWLLIPETGREQSAAQQMIGGNHSQTALFVIIAAALGGAVALSMSGLWFGIGPDFGASGLLLLIAAVVLVVWLVRRNDPPPTAQPAVPSEAELAPSPPPTQATVVLPVAEPALPPPPPPLPKPPRSVLGLLTVSAAALVAGGLLVVELAFPDTAINAITIFGAALAVVGIGLLLGAFVGRSRWLIVLGVVLTLATAASAAAQSVDLAGGVGERTWHPVSAAETENEFQLGIGDATLDLRELGRSGRRAVHPDHRIGEPWTADRLRAG